MKKSGKMARALRVCAGLIVSACFTFLSCAKANESASAAGRPMAFPFASYRDVPGVTKADGDAIEAIIAERRAAHRPFIYGMNRSAEAFQPTFGTYHGYAANMCAALSQLFGIEFVLRLYDYDVLNENGTREVDFTGALSVTSEREKTLAMTSPICERPVKLVRRADSESFAKMTDPICGILEGASFEDAVRQFSAQEFEYQFDTFSSYDEAAAALRDGAIDVFFGEGPDAAWSLAGADGIGLFVEEDLPDLVYVPIAIATEHENLRVFIDVINKVMEADKTYCFTYFYNSGLNDYNRYRFQLSLTDDERVYLYRMARRVSSIPVVYAHEEYPYSFYDPVVAEICGIAPDILAEVSAISGLSFRAANKENLTANAMLSQIESGAVSLASTIITTQMDDVNYLTPARPYAVTRYALISRASLTDIDINAAIFMRIGYKKGTAFETLLAEWFSNNDKAVAFDTNTEAFDALEKGNIDLFLTDENRLLYLTNYRGDSNYKINYVFNRSFATNFGISPRETTLSSIITKAETYIDMQSIVDRWEQKVYDYNAKNLHRIIYVSLATSLVLLSLAALIFVYYKRSRSMQKQLEAQVASRTASLRKSNDEYRALIDQLYATEAELRGARDAAEAASVAKSAFLAQMSHEIRTPMNTILGMARLVLRTPLPEEVSNDIASIRQEAAHLLQIINDILDFSKIESGRMEVVETPYFFSSLVNDVIGGARLRAEEKGLRFAVDVGSGIPAELVGDVTRLRQVVTNLLSNAVKYTEQGSVTLSITCAPRDEGAVMVTFRVSDTGIGIRDEDREKLFTKFTRLDLKHNQGIIGTGLGLSIASSLSHLMNGTIDVESVYGEGSVFTFTVPQKMTDNAGEGRLLASGADAAENLLLVYDADFHDDDVTFKPSWTANDACVLVVDDIATNLRVASGFLSLYGVHVDTSLSGGESLALVTQKREAGRGYDIIFMDHMMPQMDGIEATQKIRALANEKQDAYYRDVPIIALTANAVVGMKEMFLNKGFSGYIAKPIDLRHLDEVMSRYINDDMKVCVVPEKTENRAESRATSRSASRSASLCAQLRALPELALEKALRRLGGNEDIYTESLGILLKNIPTLLEKLRDEMAAGDIGAFAITVHGLKGSLYGIGAEKAGDAAFVLEKKAKEGDAAFCADNLEGLTQQTTILYNKIRGFVEEIAAAAPPPPEKPKGESVEFTARLRQIAALIDAFEMDEADAVLADLSGYDWGAEYNTHLEHITELTSASLYEEATRYMREKVGVSENG